MSGDTVWVADSTIFGLGNNLADGFTAATPLGQIAAGTPVSAQTCDAVLGFIPGSVGETSVVAIAIGAAILLWTGIASWRTMLSVFVGGSLLAIIFEQTGQSIAWYEHLGYGGFAFGAVFMATDPVTSCRTNCGKYIYGFLIGALAVIIRVMNPGFPEGMMLAILMGNITAPLIDHCVVSVKISRRAKRINIA